MTDFIDNLLTNMSTKFNEQKEVGPINLKEDKTLKWRGLHNNQYAAVKKRKDARKSVTNTSDTPENVLVTGEHSASVSLPEKISGREFQDGGAVDEMDNTEEGMSMRRTTRRKLNEGVVENIGRLRGRQRKRQTSPEMVANDIVIPIKVEKSSEDVLPRVAASRTRRTRFRKSTNSTDQSGSNEVTIIPLDRSKSPNLRSEEVVTAEVDTNESQTHIEQPRLRRSERTQFGSLVTDVKEIATSVDAKSEDIAKTPVIANEPSVCDSLKKYRKKGLEGLERKQCVDDGKIPQSGNSVQKPQAASHEKVKLEADNPTVADNVLPAEEDVNKRDNTSATTTDQSPEMELEPKTETADNDMGIVEPSTANTPKKRGRKPGTKILPKIEKKSEISIATRSSRVKKSPRLNNDETVFSYTLSKKDKTLNEHLQAVPHQRLSRRIKPTPKILANEELRQGFELQNNARLSLSSENLDKEIDRSPKQGINSRRPSGIRNETDNTPAAVSNGNDKVNTKVVSTPPAVQFFPMPTIANDTITTEIVRPPRRPCPDPEKFLNEIKLAKINLHRSPEDNKKLNLKQKKRLYKLKEKHLNKLGLQKTNRTGHTHSSSGSNPESDDAEEFLPAKRVNVGRPSVTLRVRGQKDIVIYDRHIMPLKNKNKQHKKNKTTMSTSPSAGSNNFPMVSISASALRNPEISLMSSKKHKQTIANGNQNVNKTANVLDTNGTANVDNNICFCAKPSKYYTKKLSDTYCAAIDQIETQKVGCCNEIESDLPNLLRPSVRVSYMVLCESHRRRLLSHNCCAGCGVFCTQGKYILCKQNHFFHRECATKFILNEAYDPSQPNFACPTLVLKCPHCGIDAPEKESTITMCCSTAPVFMPAPKTNPKLAKMSITSSSNKYEHHNSRDRQLIVNIEKIVPNHVIAILERAQNEASLAQGHTFTTKDVFYAVNNDDIERMAEIIANGFDITTPMKEFHYGTCLHLVSNFGSMKMAYLILSRVSSVHFVNRADKELRSAIMCSVVGGKNDILKLLIQCGADITLKGPDGMTALHLAAKIRNLEAVKLMLNTYRDTASLYHLEKFLNATDDGGWTAMVWASELGYADMVSIFLNSGANPNICDTENNTALHWATLSESIETVMLLLQAGCNLGVQNVNGDTPLHISCRNENTKISLLLLANGASLEVTNNTDEAPYDCIQNEHGPCGKAIFFNLQIRSIAGFPKYTVVCPDISNGREVYPIKIIRKSKAKPSKNDRNQPEFEFNDQIIPDFKYITSTILFQNATQIDRRVSQMRICSCLDNCTTQNCQCSEISIQNWYTSEGRLNADFNFQDPAMIFECNDVCGCNKLLCKNRVVQNGTKLALQVFECDDKVKGLGVQAMTKIPRGTFVSEYTGEILTDAEADRRTDDSYFFDLGSSDLCIDANFYGNVSRFINHSCEPNVVPIRVYYEHQDLRFPKIAFFACKDIEANEEITFDYGDKFWIIKYRTFTCHCGKTTCRYSDSTISKTLEEYNQRNSVEH